MGKKKQKLFQGRGRRGMLQKTSTVLKEEGKKEIRKFKRGKPINASGISDSAGKSPRVQWSALDLPHGKQVGSFMHTGETRI